MAKSAVVALAICSASFASSWNVTEGFHHWQSLGGSSVQEITLKSGDIDSLKDSIAGFSTPFIDSKGQVYAGRPASAYTPGGSKSAPGVPFVSPFGGMLRPSDTTTCELQADGQTVALTCTEFRIATGNAVTDSLFKNVRVTFQLYSKSDTTQLNYVVERQTSDSISDFSIGADAFLWNGDSSVLIASLDSLLTLPMHGKKFVLMAGGVVVPDTDYRYSFGSGKAFSSLEEPTEYRKNIRIVSGTDADEGYGWHLEDTTSRWREFDEFCVKYSIRPKNGEYSSWRVWFFNDKEYVNGTSYGINDLPEKDSAYGQNISDFGLDKDDIDGGVASSWKDLAVSNLKVMCDQCKGDTFELDSAYFTRAQPSSFIFVKDTTSKDTTPVVAIHSVYVQVLGTEGNGVTVTLTGSSDKRDSLTDSSGTTVFKSVPEGSYRLDFSKNNDKVEPSYRTFQLTSDDTIIVQIYRGAPTVKTTRIYGQEDTVRTFDLDTMGWISDPVAKAWQMSWSLKPLYGNTSIPLKLNASSRTLVLGSVGSTDTGTVRYLLTATNPYGASGSDTLVAEVGAVDQAPEIQSINWSLPLNGVLSVALDSVYKGQGVWAIDLDDAASSLVWSAEIDKASKNAATVSVVSNRLKLVPAVNSIDPILLNLIVRDPWGGADTAQVLVPVYARPAQLYAISLQQLQPTGNLDVEVSSQYTLEPIALRNNTVQVYAPSLSLWGSVPASISVLQMPTYRSGAWIDGRYSISVQRNALLKIGKGSYRLDSLLRGRNTINMLVPWAVGGDTGSFTVSAAVRFAGPLGTLNGSYLYASADTLKRSPKLALAWTWSPLPTTQTIVVKDPAGNVVDSAVLSRAESGRQISGLKDSTSYTTLLLGTDSLGNTSSVSESDTSPSGLYALTVNLNDAALSQVSGQLCLRSSSGSRTCQDLSSANAGKYVFSHLHVGRQLLTVADNHYVGVGDSLAVQIGHADTSVAWTLVRSHFLGDGALRSWERLGSGDLRFSVTPTKPLDGELPSKISLAWVAPSGTTSASPALFAISNATSDVVDGVTTWSFVLSDSLIKNQILLRDPTFGDKIRFTQIQIFTSLPNDANSDTRSDTISFPKASGGVVLWLNHEYDSLPAPQPRDWNIGRDGYSQLEYGKIDTRHGTRVIESLCLLNQNGDPESCDTSNDGVTIDSAYPMSVGTPFRLTGRALFPLATDVQPLVSGFDENGEFLQAPWGSLQAGAQWRVYSDTDTTVNVWALASKSSIASLPSLYLMQDSGRSEIGSTSLWTTASKWRSVGAVRLVKGWNTLPILADSGIRIRAISLRKDKKDESVSFSTLHAVPDTIFAVLKDSLKPDRTYRLKLQQVDAYGNRSPVSDTTFLVEPSGYFSDMSVEQQANGDLVLYSRGTSVANHPGMRVRLTAGAATSPISFDPTTDSGVAIRVLRDSLPAQLFGSTGTESSPVLGPITLVWDSGFQVTHRYWSWRCWCHCSSTKTLSKRDSVVLQWPGLSPWKSVHDYRAVPRPTVTVVDTGSDSIALRLSGLNPTDSAGTRGQYRGSLHVEWTPGSNCNASSARDLDFGNVFEPDALGRIAFRPSYAAAWDSKVGAWADTIESRAARRQWLDRPDGGGFYPYTRWSTERGDSSQPWIDFKVKSPSTSDIVYSLWVLPGTGNTDSSRSFYWSMNGTESSLLNEGVAEYLSSGAWVRQSAPVILHSGLNTLRIAMHQDGFSLKGILLQPASALAPDTSFHGDSLSRFGFSGYDSILVQAGGLASGVSHTFKIAAQDRVGNRSDTLTVLETTPTTKTQIAALRLLPSPWDNTGWVNSALSVGIAKDSSLLTGTLPQTVRGLLLKVDRFKTAPDTQEILTASSLSDTTWNMPIAGLPSWPSNQAEFSAGSHYQLVVWGEVNGEKGPSVTLGFGVRTGSAPGQLSGNLSDYSSQGVLFHPLVTWADGANIFSNLELKNFARKEGDSVHYHLVLHGAQVSLDTSTSNWSITGLSGGLFQSQRCVLSGGDSTCTESSAMPWGLGPWTGEIPVSGMVFTTAKGFQVESAHLLDDKKRLVRSQPAFLIDGGIRDTLSVLKDRFWFRNVVAHDTGDAFSIEGCRTSMTQSDGVLHMTASGCTDNAGPFLVFDVVLETAGPDSWMGSAYDSLPLPYHLDWASGTGYLAKDSAVVTRTSLRNFSGASLWGYDVHAYKFDSSGVVLRNFDLLLPQGKVFPGDSSGDSTTRQKISGFSGAHIASVKGTMSGMPVLLGSAQSSSKKSIIFDSLDVLSGHSGWDYSSYVGYGFALTPQNANNAMTMNIPQPAGNFRYTKINGQSQDTDTIRMPISSLVFGPGEYAFVADTQSFEARAGGVSLSGTLTLSFLDQDLSVTTTGVSGILDSFFTEASGDFPGTFSSQTVSDVSLGLNEWFGLQSVQASGAVSANNALLPPVYVAGLPWIPFQASAYQLMRGNNDIYVRLLKPSVKLQFWPSTTSLQSSDPSTWVYAAIFNSHRMPVAVASRVAVPENWTDLSLPGFKSFGSVLLERLDFEAGIESDTAYARVSGPATIEFGSLFDKIGIAGWRLPLTNVGFELSKNVSSNALSAPIARLTALQTGSLGIPLSLSLTKKRIRKWFSNEDADGSSNPEYVHLYTGGNSISAHLLNQDAIDVGIGNWNLQLTDSFPVSAMRGLNFHLDTLGVRYSNEKLSFTAFRGSGSKQFDSLEILPGFVLLPKKNKQVTVSLENDSTNTQSKETIAALAVAMDSIRLGSKVYSVGCGNSAKIKFRLDGKLEGSVCVTEKDDISIYPIGSIGDERKVWIANGGTSGPWLTLNLSFNGSKLSISVDSAHIMSSELPVVGSLDLKAGIKFTVSSSGMELDSVSVIDSVNKSTSYGPFTLGIATIGLRAWDTTISAGNTRKWFGISATPTFGFSTGTCTSKNSGTASFSSPIYKSPTKWKLDWSFAGNMSCTIASLKAEAMGIRVSNGGDGVSVGVDTLTVSLGKVKDYIPRAPDTLGLRVIGLSYANNLSVTRVEPIGLDSIDQLHLEIPYVGVEVWSKLNILPLFDSHKPGIAFDDIRVKLPPTLGGETYPTNFAVRLDGEEPYIHARGNLKGLHIPVPSIELTPAIKFQGAKLNLRFVEGDSVRGTKDSWVFEGSASLGLPGLVSGIDVEMALKKPDSKDCRTGICKAALTLEMKNSPVPLGTTGLYMAGLKGAFYDGSYVPECAQNCGIMSLPNGMKFEFAIFVQAQDPSVLNGVTGFWMQLNKLDFGIDGTFSLMQGEADASACAALYGNGSIFHGQFGLELHTTLWAKGDFYIDIWSDDHGKNMAAEADASVGLNRGAIIHCRWFKYPRHRSLFGPFVTRFGRFKNGSNGFTTGVRLLGRTWGLGYVDGSFRLGDIGRYKLATPSGSSLTPLSTSDYAILPLGVDLQGDELITAMVASAEGTDWRGQQLHLVNASNVTVNTVTKTVMGINLDDSFDSTGVEREDSLNFHRLTWNNYNHTGRVYFIAPLKAGTSATSSEIDTSASISKSWGDEQFIIGLVPPSTENLTARACSDSTICISGTIQHFHAMPRTIQRSLNSTEKALNKNADGTSQTLLSQKNRLNFYLMRKELKQGSIQSDSGAAMELPLEEFTGQPAGALSLVGNACAVADTASGTLTLNNCQWSHAAWSSGTYRLQASIEAVNLLQDGKVIPEDSSTDVVELSRVDLTPSDSFFVWKNSRPLLPVQALTVYTSALDSTMHPGADERRRVSLRWKTHANPDLGGYAIRWIFTNSTGTLDSTDFQVGATDHWSIDVPDSSLMSKHSYDTASTNEEAAILDTATNPTWFFSPPKTLRVLPYTLSDDDSVTTLSKRNDLAVSWTGDLLLGTPGVDDTTNRLTMVRKDNSDTARRIPRGSTDNLTLLVAHGAFQSDTTALCPATDYASLELQWLDSLKKPIGDTATFLPSVGGNVLAWHVSQVTDTISLAISPLSRDVPCASILGDSLRDSAKKPVKDTTFRSCAEGEFLQRATPFGLYYLQVTGWNEGRRAAGAAAKLEIPVQVTLPKPSIDVVETPYLLNGTTQDLTFRATRLWGNGGMRPQVRFTTKEGVLLDTLVIPGADTLTTFDSTLVIPWRGRTFALGKDTEEIQMTVVNRGPQGTVESSPWTIEFVKTPNSIACLESSLPVNVAHYAWAMDFNGFYPKQLHVGDSVFAQFSEIHNYNHRQFNVLVLHGTDTDIVAYVPMADGLRFKLPESLDSASGSAITLKIEIPENDTGAAQKCQGRQWSSVFNLLSSRTGSGSGYRIEVASGRFRVHGLTSDESMVWNLGVPDSYNPVSPVQGDTNWISVAKTDYIHMRITNKVSQIVDTVFFVEAPVALSVRTSAGRALAARDSLLSGTRLYVSSAPSPVLSKAGASSLSLQCRWNDAAWAACPDAGWTVGASISGMLHVRPVWGLHGRTDTTLYGGEQLWNVSLRGASGYGWSSSTLSIPGTRLRRLLDSTEAGAVVTLRRQGAQLARWSVQAPVVRDAQGAVLSQQVLNYDSAGKNFVCRVRIPSLVPGSDLPVQLWAGDTTARPLPTIAGEVFSVLPKDTLALPGTDGNGYSMGYWFHWHGRADTLFRNNDHILVTDSQGTLTWSWGSDTVRSVAQALDTATDHLLGLTWSSRSGEGILSLDGRPVGAGSLHVGTHSGMPANTVRIASGAWWLDWKPVPETPQGLRLRWESERSHGALWNPDSTVAGTRPVLQGFSGAALDTVGLSQGARLWGDREDSVVTFPTALAGALLVQGQAARRADTSSYGGYWQSAQSAEVCLVQDSGWTGLAGWTRSTAWNVNGLALWCRMSAAGDVFTPGPRHGSASGNLQGNAWILRLLPDRASSQTPFQVGDTADGWILQKVPTVLDSAVLLKSTTLASGAKTVNLSGPGLVWIVLPTGSLMDSLLSHGWASSGISMVAVNASTGQSVTLHLLYPTSSAVLGVLTWSSSADPVLVFVASGTSTAIVKTSSTVRTDTIRSGSGTKIVLSSGDTVSVSSLPGTTVIETPRDCQTRSWEVTLGRASTQWLAIAPEAGVSSIEGWTSSGTVQTSDGEWPVWSRVLTAGVHTTDLTQVLDPNTCAKFFSWFQDIVNTPPSWLLGEVRVHALGGGRKAVGGLHMVQNLDLEPAAALDVHSDQHQLRLTSSSGWGEQLGSAVLGLGDTKVVETVDSSSGSSAAVVISKHWTLSDLRADLLDADSVTVDAVTLATQGVVRLTIKNHGATPFTSGLSAVLFRDGNGNYQYDAGTDSSLGVQTLPRLEAGQSAVLEFPVSGTVRRFPEELFFAWIDGGAYAPEFHAGDHVAIGPSPCRRRLKATWTSSADSLTAPTVAAGLFPGLSQALGVRLWDSNGDSIIDGRDSAQFLWLGSGRLWLARQGGDTLWSASTSVASLSDISVRDVQGDGIPEIVAGNEIWSRTGQRLWDGGSAPSQALDLADEGLVDSIAVKSSCVEVWSGQRELLWSSSSCARQGTVSSLAAISRLVSGCSDISVSAPKALLAGNGFSLRIANAGTVDVPAGIPIHLAQAGVLRATSATTRILHPGEWEDVSFLMSQVPTGTQWKAWSETSEAAQLGILDSHPLNNAVQWGN